MIKGVIFDLDGVLLFTDQYHYQAWKKMADDEGIYFDEEINNRLRGVSRMESLEIILEKSEKTYTQEEKEQLAEKKNNIYKELLKELTPNSIAADVRTTLDSLKQSGLKLAIGSSSKNTMMILEKTDLLKYFDEVSDGTKIKKSKPDPEVFLLAKDLLKLKTEDCLVIEDAKSGIDAATAGGFKSCGIGEASSYEKTTYPIEKLSDILKIVKPEKHKIELKHVKKVYPNGLCAVKDFSLEIEPEEFVVFVGPSGCGKSTVLRMIAGLEEITEGTLLIDGEEMNDVEPIRRNISMVFQNYALYPHLTVRQNIVFPLSIQKIPLKKFFNFKYRKERKERIKKIGEEVAAKINLSEYLDTKPKNLSGGQRQRVALGRAIVRNPKAFLLDEPLSNLDAKMRTQMRTEISKLHNDLKSIFIYVTHDQVEAMTMGSKIVVMKDGYIQQIASPNELFLNPINKFVAGFIGTPQMNFIDVDLHKEADESIVRLANGVEVMIPKKIAAKIPENYLGKQVTMGLRPKALVPKSSKTKDLCIEGEVKLSEQLGDELLMYLSFPGCEGEFISSSESYITPEIGSKVLISFNMEHVCFFDSETEESILYEKM